MKKLIAFFKRIYSFMRYDIWMITEHELSRSRAFTYRIIKTILLAARGFNNNNLDTRASALTFSILFAIVPLFALIVAIAKGFGVEKLIEDSLQGTYIAQVNMVPTVMGFVERYLESTQGGFFIGIGIAILFWAVMNFFMQVERFFNDIWQVEKSRSPIRQFSTYFSIILIIPLLIVLSSGLSIFVNTILKDLNVYDLLSPLLRFGVKIIPFFINWIVFTIMYMVIPNTRVRFINAMIAGLIAGTAFQVFQMLYITGQVYLSRYNVVYGSFAAIPLLFLWLQISCMIVLIGAEISYASQNLRYFDFEIDTKNISTRYKNFLTLFVAYVVIKQFENQKPALTAEEISHDHKIPISLVNHILDRLVQVSVFVELYNEKNESKTYLPAFDINKLTVNLLFSKLETKGSEEFISGDNKMMNSFWKKMLDMKKRTDECTGEVLVKDF